MKKIKRETPKLLSKEEVKEKLKETLAEIKQTRLEIGKVHQEAKLLVKDSLTFKQKVKAFNPSKVE